jgi:hypothetical protein
MLAKLMLAVCLLGLTPALAQDAEPVRAGRVELVDGEVRFHDAKGVARKPAPGDPLYQGESIVTGKDGEVHLEMEDGGLIAIRPNSNLSITDFKAEGVAETDRIGLKLLQGTLRSISGWIAKARPASYTIRTPNATIGIRGTDHEPYYISESSALGEPGTYDKVNAGHTYIESRLGRIEVPVGRAAFAHHRPELRPRLLTRTPRHFRGSKHEARLKGRHQRIQKRLEKQRDERRKAVEERRAKLEEKQEERREEQLEKREERKEQLNEQREERKERAQERREEAQKRRSLQQERAQEKRRQTQERRRPAPEKRRRRE